VADAGTLISGQLAGRIQPVGWTPPDGDWVILIGSENIRDEDVALGDKDGFEQSIDLTSVDLIRWAMRFRQTTSTTLKFRASVTVDGAEYWAEELAVGAVSDYSERTINVSGITGTKTVAIFIQALNP
jgi:hypothetical protein